VNSEDEAQIRQVLSSVRNKFNLKTIHWRQLTDFNKRVYVVSQLSECHFTYINIIFDTNQYDETKISSGEYVYNFMCKLLLERASWFIDGEKRKANIVLASRGTSKDADLVSYIKDKLFTYAWNNILDVFEKVSVKAATTWDMLQLADICATTTFNTYEENWLGFTTPCHTSKLRGKMYKRNGRIINNGIKYFTESMKPEKDYFEKRQPCDFSKK